MVLNKIAGTLCIIFFSLQTQATIEKNIQPLKKIETKQILSNLRFISKDGKVTLYQKNNGELSVSKNYKIKVLLKGKKYTNYQIIEGQDNFLLISMDENYFSLINPNKNKKIFLLDLSNLKIKKVAEGTDPRLHLEDTWFSYYKARQKKVYFSKLTMPPKEINLSMNAALNPFFVPEREILKNQSIIFSDMNKKGELALLRSFKNKTSVIKKYSTLTMNLEICQSLGQLIIGEFDSSVGNPSGKILLLKNNKLDEQNPLYSSTNNDLGKINCTFRKGNVYFIKTIPHETLKHSELVELNMANKKITQLTEEKFVHQFFPMGSRLFATINGKQLLVIGEKELTDDRLPSDGR
jgi:hypothetical protein